MGSPVQIPRSVVLMTATPLPSGNAVHLSSRQELGRTFLEPSVYRKSTQRRRSRRSWFAGGFEHILFRTAPKLR